MKTQFFKVGQTVWWLHHVHEGTVVNIHEEDGYQVEVKFKDSSMTRFFDSDGKFYKSDSEPCLYQTKPIITPNKPLLDEFQVGDRVECELYGLGTVINTINASKYSVIVELDSGFEEYYQKNGRINEYVIKPTLRKV